ncbi:sulfatase-like hydrolase/transferase [Crateriforma conspicua]|uniref:sulfatase-like hydrolase/transferase n=1 Tax=Crateriforma conspicua TaxID=2527996 RepID=UPI0011884535|nr:sulfatase-like hydrolase/transferase [Crateriforma conspicua]QDV62843.1 Arylsulfatase precursor [Crateriforma conspicua]
MSPRTWLIAFLAVGSVPVVTPVLCSAADRTIDGDGPVDPVFNRAPLAAKPYSELPLGSIQPCGWLRDELQRMADGMTGHLDQWYPEVCGDRNAWLGGDGDTWERGPYWIDGLYPLAKLLDDRDLEAKAMRWIEWTLANQRESGQIGPYGIKSADRTVPPPRGAQVLKPDDWWPRMVMLKILQQHYMATGDPRVIESLTRYFRFQLSELPKRPLHDPDNPASGSWWAAQRGGDNLMVVLWLYNVTGDAFLLELADLIHQQTVPVTDWFSPGVDNMIRRRGDQGDALHCVNLAQMMKTPVIRWQQDQDDRHLAAVANAFADIRTFHGQPHGLYGGDEAMHGDAPERGSELCTAVEMMYSLEKMFEITGDVSFGDRLEKIAFNALPTQCTDDHHARQYFQQTNQVQCTFGSRDFFNDHGDRVVYGLVSGYPCCTCNLHQGWPKFAQHLWMASADGGLAAVAYAPSVVTTRVDGNRSVTLSTDTGYPFHSDVAIDVSVDSGAVSFPLHVRIPAWAEGAQVRVNEGAMQSVDAGTMHVLARRWESGDRVELHFPMPLRSTTWFARSKAIERGPLVFALDVPARWDEVVQPRPDGVPETAMHRGYREAHPTQRWNYALPGAVVNQPDANVQVDVADSIPDNPWTSETAPVRLTTVGIRLSEWTVHRNSAAVPPLSPVDLPKDFQRDEIALIPYGATTLRVTEFPWVRNADASLAFTPDQWKFSRAFASYTHPNNTADAVRMPIQPVSSSDKSRPRWTSWPQRGQDQWIEIRFDGPRELRSLGVYFYDDQRGIRPPGNWTVQTDDGDGWKDVTLPAGATYTAKADQYNDVDLGGIVTRAVRLSLQPSGTDKCIGVMDVRVDSRPADPSSASKEDSQAGATSADPRPNFVFLITDDISPDDLSIYGNDFVSTPNLKRLADRGLVFDNAYLTISSCSPSRCSMITGRYPHNTGASELHLTLPDDQTTFVQLLRDAGYHTMISGKNHMAPPQQLGFVESSDAKPAGAEKWVQHLRNRPADRPFFAWFASHDAHRAFEITDDAPVYDPQQVQVPPMMFDGPETRAELAGFYHEVSRTDHFLGKVMDELQRQGIAENTYLVYCSDNGRPFPRCKTYLYDSGIQTPLVVAGPGVAVGRTESLVSSIDYAGTFLELAGLEHPDTVQGVSLVDVFQDPDARVRDVAFAERNWHVYQNHQRAVRAGDWLYIWNAWPDRYSVAGESSSYVFAAVRELWQAAERGKLNDAQALLTLPQQPAEMLFNVRNDPCQFDNLADEARYAETLGTMRQLFRQWERETGDCVPQHPTPDRQSLHKGGGGNTERGQQPGQANGAMKINAAGPVWID